VFSSSPSTRFLMPTKDVDGLTEEEMPSLPQKAYVQEYAKTKAEAEVLVRKACSDDLLTISVAPHQVYGPRDNLFMPNLLEVASIGRLRVFGPGQNRICFTHVDNYAHALILGEKALYPGSPALGTFYIATDGDTHPHSDGYCVFWDEVDDILVKLGFESINAKFHLPFWFMMCVGFICEVIGACIGKKLKVSRFSVKMLTMHRWFKIDAVQRDLGYKPLIGFREGWAEAGGWFKEKWLPIFQSSASGFTGGVAEQTQAKIDIHTSFKGASTMKQD